MPTPIIHLCVAKKLTESLKINNISGFYLGSTAPDAFYLRHTYYDVDGHYGRHFAAHLNDPDFSVWKNKAKDLIQEYSSDKNKDFYFGYGVHIMTDIIWKETIYAGFSENFPGKSPDEIREVWYREAEQLDYGLYLKYEMSSKIKEILSNSVEAGVGDLVYANEVKSFKKNILLLFDDFEKNKRSIKLNYITLDKLEDFLTFSHDEILKHAVDIEA